MPKHAPHKTITLAICFVIVFIVALIGSIFTTKSSQSTWYESVKPSIAPPNWVFGPVWTVLFILIALSMYYAWTTAIGRKEKEYLVMLFGINLALNVLWSVFYFGMQNPLLAFVDIVLLVVSIILLIAYTGRIRKSAAWLLVPYLVWVLFAAMLNAMSI
jgi:tryptophan-rich sensory protein